MRIHLTGALPESFQERGNPGDRLREKETGPAVGSALRPE